MKTEQVEQLQQQLAAQIDSLVTSEDWLAMLAVSAKFHKYSLNNQLLIWRQCETATRVAGFRAWQSMGRQVRKGEKAIRILAPARYKRKDENGEDKWVVRGFTTACVFDVSQTDGDPLPDDIHPELLSGDIPSGLWESVAALVTDCGYTLERGDCDGANGFTRWGDKVVRVRDDVDDRQAFKTLVHELAHIRCEHDKREVSRDLKECEAESVAYVVCAALGIASGEYSLPYVAHWSGGSSDQVKSTATTVTKVAGAILASLESLVTV